MKSWKAVLLLASLVTLLMLIDETLRWTDHRRGFLNGAFNSLIFFPFLCLYASAWIYLILGLITKIRPSWRNWYSAMLPAVVILGMTIWDLPTSRKRFQNITKTAFPAKVDDLHVTHQGGGFADHRHLYSFTTTPETTQQLIVAMKLSAPTDLDQEEAFFKPPGEFIDWEDPVIYRRETDDYWFFDLITDKSHQKVFIQLWSL